MKTSLRVAAIGAAATLAMTTLSTTANAAGFIGAEELTQGHSQPSYWAKRLGGTCFKLKGNVKQKVNIQLPDNLPTQATVIVKAGNMDYIYTADNGEYFVHNQKDPKTGKVKHVAQVIVCHSIKNDETPGTETPGTETPGTETPGTETPGTETPGTETPGTETPGTETPGTETPGTETPGTETPGTETPEKPKPQLPPNTGN